MKRWLATVLSIGVVVLGYVGLCAQHASQPGAPDILVQQEEIEVAPREQVYGYGEAPVGHPEFEFGAIKLKSGGVGKCGALTLMPYPGSDVIVRSQKYSKRWFGAEATPTGKPLSPWVEVPQGGLRMKYDRAGFGQDHYKIHCRVTGPHGSRSVDCQRVLSIQYPKQGHCFAGPGGTDAGYSPLNMRTKSK